MYLRRKNFIIRFAYINKFIDILFIDNILDTTFVYYKVDQNKYMKNVYSKDSQLINTIACFDQVPQLAVMISDSKAAIKTYNISDIISPIFTQDRINKERKQITLNHKCNLVNRVMK